jgi:dTDP-4-dehydrorhamnose reductase
VLVTGAGGLLGRYVVNRFSGRHEVVAVTHQDLDIAQREAVEQTVGRLRPAVIINCAALSQVDLCETDPERAFAVNAQGPRHLAEVCRQIGAELVHISTDYVFDGTKNEPYTIEDQENPVNLYGQSKLAGERFARDTLDRCYVVRVARLFGQGGRNFASAVVDLARRGGRVFGIIDEVGSPTYAKDLADRLETIISLGQPGVYHITNQGACSFFELAEEALRIAGLDRVVIEKVNSVDLGRPARRPAYTALRCLLSERLGLKPLRPWQEAIAEFVALGK